MAIKEDESSEVLDDLGQAEVLLELCCDCIESTEEGTMYALRAIAHVALWTAKQQRSITKGNHDDKHIR